MAFVKVQKATGLGNTGLGRYGAIRLGAHLADNNVPRSIYISITPDVIDSVGWEIVHAQSQRKTKSGELYERAFCRIALNEGVGTDAGFIQLSEDKERGYVVGTTKGTRTSFTCSVGMAGIKHYVFNEVPVDPGLVEFTVDPEDKTILIQCPDWLRYNPESYQEPTPAKQEVKKEPRRPPTLSVVVVDKAIDEELMPNRHQRRKITKRLAQALRA